MKQLLIKLLKKALTLLGEKPKPADPLPHQVIIPHNELIAEKITIVCQSFKDTPLYLINRDIERKVIAELRSHGCIEVEGHKCPWDTKEPPPFLPIHHYASVWIVRKK